jgi:hypothetical protein
MPHIEAEGPPGIANVDLKTYRAFFFLKEGARLDRPILILYDNILSNSFNGVIS